MLKMLKSPSKSEADPTNAIDYEPWDEKEVNVAKYSNDDHAIAEENEEHPKQCMDPII